MSKEPRAEAATSNELLALAVQLERAADASFLQRCETLAQIKARLSDADFQRGLRERGISGAEAQAMLAIAASSHSTQH